MGSLPSLQTIGVALFIFVCIYFLFRVGIRLATDTMGDMTWPAWFFTACAMLFGLEALNKEEAWGFLGFLPVMTYILIRIMQGVDMSYSTQAKIKGVVFSGVASSITYVVTHSLFGFGIPEASVSAVIAAGILGVAGYNA